MYLFHWLLTFFTAGLGAVGGFCFGAGRLSSKSSESRLPRGLWSSPFCRRTEGGKPTVASKVGTPRRWLWWLELGSSLGGSGSRLSMSSSLGSGRLTNLCSILICVGKMFNKSWTFEADVSDEKWLAKEIEIQTNCCLKWHYSTREVLSSDGFFSPDKFLMSVKKKEQKEQLYLEWWHTSWAMFSDTK